MKCVPPGRVKTHPAQYLRLALVAATLTCHPNLLHGAPMHPCRVEEGGASFGSKQAVF